MKIEIPEGVKANVTVQVALPPEALQILKDLHADRENVGLGGAIIVCCAVLTTVRAFLKKE